jgi:putative ABC transport system ATP-binding protein
MPKESSGVGQTIATEERGSRLLVEATNLEKTYRDRQGQLVPVLTRLSLQVAPGEFLAISGPSGSGKSTLLNILGCLDRPDAGSYTFDGQQVDEWPERSRAELRNRRIGFVFQKFHLLPFLSVKENIELPFLYLKTGIEPDGNRVEELLNFMGLDGKQQRYPSELSAGEQQRVAIARALVLGADLILADEPTGNLDPDTARGVIELFERLILRGTTVLLVTHDPIMAARAHRHLHLSGGRLAQHRVALEGGQL